jgi:hypothetical protein
MRADLKALQAWGVQPMEQGTVAFHGKAAQLFRNIDSEVKTLASALRAEEVILPSSMSQENFRLSGYGERFPQFVTMLSSPNDLPKRACCSAVCLPCYPSFAGRIFSDGTEFSLTVLGKVFRSENLNACEPERLSEFNVRDIVFFGSEKFVGSSLAACSEWLKSLVIECELRGSIEPAEDPFFCPDAQVLTLYQRVNQTKFELLLDKPGTSQKTAVASLNQHGSHFSKAFTFKFASGEFVNTGCFGLGLERLLFSILNQFGPDETSWPLGLRSRFGPLNSRT